MSVLSAQTIRRLRFIEPFYERTLHGGMTFGLGPSGYDVRIAEDIKLEPNYETFSLASTIEHFAIPNNVIGYVCDKSSWARLGLSLFNTIIEPGWRGYLTLELTCLGKLPLKIHKGMPIAQIIFNFLDEPTDCPYDGKYQDQQAGPQKSILKYADEH